MPIFFNRDTLKTTIKKLKQNDFYAKNPLEDSDDSNDAPLSYASGRPMLKRTGGGGGGFSMLGS
jgi:hypothetical protein